MSKKKSSPPTKASRPSRWLQVTILSAVAIAIVLILTSKNQPPPAQIADAAGSPQEQLDALVQAGTPTLAFFHSDSCQQCLDMMGIVDEVFPTYKETIGLVDVNVYDSRNASLLKMARITVIPTLVFIDRKGEGRVSVGVMPAEQLHEQLRQLTLR